MEHAQRPVEMSSQHDPHQDRMKYDFLSVNTQEKSSPEQGDKMTAATMPTATLNDTATEAKLEGDIKEQDAEPEDDQAQYPRGVTFVLLTIGLMAVVLVVAMDNYIIGAFGTVSCLQLYSTVLTGPCSNGDSSNNVRLRRP